MTSIPPPPGQNPPPQDPWPVQGPQAPMMRPPAGYGAVLLTMQGNMFSSTPNSPTVQIDGYPVPGTYGTTFYPLVPGRHLLHLHGQWMRQFGQADLQVDIVPGQTVPVFYAPPWHQFTSGSIGHEKQSRKGLGAMIAIVAVTALVVLLCCIGSALLG